MKSKRRKLSRDKRSGQYFVRIQVDGVRKYFPLGTQKKAAEVELTRLERLHECGELSVGDAIVEEPMPVPLPVSVAEDEIMLKYIIDVHLEWVEVHRARSTFEMRQHYLDAFLKYAGDRPVASIDKLLLAGFHGWAKKNHSQSSNGGNIFLRNVKSMFLWAEDMNVCRCPVRKFPYMPETPPLTKRFTDEELTILLDCIKQKSPDFHDMIVFALLTGLRPPELREIKRHHYIKDEEGKEYIEFQRHKTAKSTREPGKRTVPLVPEAVEIPITAKFGWIISNSYLMKQLYQVFSL